MSSDFQVNVQLQENEVLLSQPIHGSAQQEKLQERRQAKSWESTVKMNTIFDDMDEWMTKLNDFWMTVWQDDIMTG